MKSKPKIFKKEFGVEQNFIKLFNVKEHLIVGTSLAFTVAIFIYNAITNPAKQSTYLTFVGSVLNIFAAASIIKKKSIFPLIALVASLVLIPVAGIEHTYAMMFMYMLNSVTMTISLITGLKNSDVHANIKPRSIKGGQTLIYCIILAGLVALYTGVEGLQSYQDGMAPERTPKPVPIPTGYFRMFDSASLMITVGEIIPLILRLKNIFPLYIAGNIAQLGTGISRLVLNPTNLNAGMMIVNTLMFLITNILGIINGSKEEQKQKV